MMRERVISLLNPPRFFRGVGTACMQMVGRGSFESATIEPYRRKKRERARGVLYGPHSVVFTESLHKIWIIFDCSDII